MNDAVLDDIVISTGGNMIRIPIKTKHFNTGSRGYHASGKLNMNGKRYQLNLNIVEIGSKYK